MLTRVHCSSSSVGGLRFINLRDIAGAWPVALSGAGDFADDPPVPLSRDDWL